MTTTMTIATGPDEEITTIGVVAEAEAAIRGQKWSGADDVISHRC
jgi:hypothetical protein